MKTAPYTEIICRGFCPFYRKGKEELTCGTYNFLEGILTAEELKLAVRQMKAVPELSGDQEIIKLICERCDFRTDGCDFREGADSQPCGGYTIVEALMRKSLIPSG